MFIKVRARMNKWRICLICLLGALQLSAFAAPKEKAPKEKKEKKEKKVKIEEPKRVYMFGVAENFNDSTVYLTDVQYLDSMMTTPEGSLLNHAGYSLQLKVYLEGTLNELNQTCAVIYSDKKKKLDKRFTKMRKRYEADKNKTLRRVGTDDFTFQRR